MDFEESEGAIWGASGISVLGFGEGTGSGTTILGFDEDEGAKWGGSVVVIVVLFIEEEGKWSDILGESSKGDTGGLGGGL